MTVEVQVGGRTRRVDARGADVVIDGQRVHADAVRFGDTVSLVIGPSEVSARGGRYGRCYEVAVVDQGAGELLVHVNGRPIVVRVFPAAGRAGGPPSTRRPDTRGREVGAGPCRVVAPMPGRIAKVLVRVGDVVAARQSLVVVEAMKMENELRSPRAGTVVDVRVLEGARVEANAVLVVVE